MNELYNSLRTMQDAASLVSISAAKIATSLETVLKGMAESDQAAVQAGTQSFRSNLELLNRGLDTFERTGSGCFLGGRNESAN